jgi:alpha-beta hydrolase superfamily lysophospholipase
VTDERNLPGVSPALRRRLQRLFRFLTWLSPLLAARVAAFLLCTPLAQRPDAADDAFHATARRRRLHTPSGSVETCEWAGSGPTVLIVHGWISHSGRFAALINALRQRGFRVVTFDAPGHGRSGGHRADLITFRTAIETVAREFGPVDALVSHSFGALAAAVWLGHTTLPPPRAVVFVGMMRSLDYLIESFIIVMQLRADVTARLHALMTRHYGVEPGQLSARALAPHIRMPVLLVHGGIDDLVPSAHAGEIAALLDDARTLIVPGQRHSEPLRDAATIATMVRFLAEHTAAAARHPARHAVDDSCELC